MTNEREERSGAKPAEQRLELIPLWPGTPPEALGDDPESERTRIADCGVSGNIRIVSVQDLETAVTQLPKEELARFSKWFEEYIADQWDRQIETDVTAGRFEGAGQRAKADYEAGRCTPL